MHSGVARRLSEDSWHNILDDIGLLALRPVRRSQLELADVLSPACRGSARSILSYLDWVPPDKPGRRRALSNFLDTDGGSERRQRLDIIGEFPESPPVQLSEASATLSSTPTLGSRPRSAGSAVQLSRSLLSLKPMSYTATEPYGKTVFGTQGMWFTLHRHTHVFDDIGAGIAMLVYRIFTLRSTWDILSYEPVCPTQQVYEYDGDLPLYAFASVTRRLWPLIWPRWDIQLYNCDGSLASPILEVASRFWFSFFTYLNILEPGSQEVIGTIDSAAWWALGTTMNVWLAKGVDRALMLTSALAVDVDQWHMSAPNSRPRRST